MYRSPLVGGEATFRGVTPTPYLMLRFWRYRIYGGFVFSFFARAAVSCRQFSFVSGVVFAVFVVAKLTSFF